MQPLLCVVYNKLPVDEATYMYLNFLVAITDILFVSSFQLPVAYVVHVHILVIIQLKYFTSF